MAVLRDRLQAVLDRASADGGRRALLVVSLDRGDTLFSHGADVSLAPASNLKLYSTAAALSYLGADFRWSTYLVAEGPVTDGVLAGDMVLYGTGDPTLSVRMASSARQVFRAMADSLHAAGVREVRGDVVGDGSYFGGEGIGDGWNPNDLRSWYAAPTGALNADENVVRPKGRPVGDPALHAAELLRSALAAEGIAVHGTVRTRFRGAPSPEVFSRDPAAAARIVAIHRSPALGDVAAVTNHLSHNLFADAMLRTAARKSQGDGSFAAGQGAVRRMLARADADADTARLHLLDGSGLSRLDRVSARSTVALLAWMARGPLAEVYAASLPAAGDPRGLKRMAGTAADGRLRAKTGTIHGVSSLSGYVTTVAGERLAFSIIANGVPDVHRAKRYEDEIGAALASFTRE
ncbi:MAG TPA: D-alanyl-D-alanine carboxypeptidase/D-alanyl-D-alanine-endopeptidase [Longimicrobiaceae bacterium]|nr:D-alanyl-D-alanine carboxypeptidase/D-alanyl-D-alanine-endopeptidase [Longimicrobiaceae bacterium]